MAKAAPCAMIGFAEFRTSATGATPRLIMSSRHREGSENRPVKRIDHGVSHHLDQTARLGARTSGTCAGIFPKRRGCVVAQAVRTRFGRQAAGGDGYQYPTVSDCDSGAPPLERPIRVYFGTRRQSKRSIGFGHLLLQRLSFAPRREGEREVWSGIHHVGRRRIPASAG